MNLSKDYDRAIEIAAAMHRITRAQKHIKILLHFVETGNWD